jgi:nucleotide-binding universal stress UspA family protein
MYASDFSPASLVALPHAIDIAKATRAELIIFHVLPSPIPFVGEMTYIDQDTSDRIFAGAHAAAQQQLDALLVRAREAGVGAIGLVVEATTLATPAEEIVRAAQEKRAGILVLGTHGRTGIAKFFLGSVAARVVATAPCPVLTVRTPEHAE